MKKTLLIVLIVISAIITICASYVALFGMPTFSGNRETVYFRGLIQLKEDVKYTEIEIKTDEITNKAQMQKAADIIKKRLKESDIKVLKTKITDGNGIYIRCLVDKGKNSVSINNRIENLCRKGQITFCKGSTYDSNEILFTGKHIKTANVAFDESKGYVVFLELDETGTSIFALVTEELTKTMGQIAICVDETVITAPSVVSAITDGKLFITGFETNEEASEIADKIIFGELPYDFYICSVVQIN